MAGSAAGRTSWGAVSVDVSALVSRAGDRSAAADLTVGASVVGLIGAVFLRRFGRRQTVALQSM